MGAKATLEGRGKFWTPPDTARFYQASSYRAAPECEFSLGLTQMLTAQVLRAAGCDFREIAVGRSQRLGDAGPTQGSSGLRTRRSHHQSTP